jgi:hypothetical protein
MTRKLFPFLCVTLLAVFSAHLIRKHMTAESVHAADRRSASFLAAPVTLQVRYRGAASASRWLDGGQATPLSLAGADFDVDGVDDLASGYATPQGGVITP